MRDPLLISLSAILVCAPAFSDETSQRLSVEFETAVANIVPRATDQPVQFPDLTFALRGETHCHAPDSIASVSVSIADSRLTIVPDPERQGVIEETMRVPHQQLGPIVVNNFCLADESESLQYLELEGALSAHLSLRCSSENQNSISYATSALNVAIQCQSEDPELPEQDDTAAE